MLTAAHMEQLIRRYYAGCNEADVAKMAGCFTPDAVHYFPPGMPGGPFRGAQVIAESWRHVVQKAGARWTIDALLLDPASARAVIEWSNFTQGRNRLVRGTEWVEFDRESGLIREIRAYLAAPLPRDLEQAQLEGFDYTGRAIPCNSPAGFRPGARTGQYCHLTQEEPGMPKQQISTKSGAAPIGAYSQGLRAGDFVFVSGQGPLDPQTGKVVGTTIEEQTTRVLENIKAILAAGGATMADVVKVSAHLSDLSLFERYNKVYATYFPDPKPTRTTVGSQLPGILVEIDAVAYVGK